MLTRPLRIGLGTGVHESGRAAQRNSAEPFRLGVRLSGARESGVTGLRGRAGSPRTSEPDPGHAGAGSSSGLPASSFEMGAASYASAGQATRLQKRCARIVLANWPTRRREARDRGDAEADQTRDQSDEHTQRQRHDEFAPNKPSPHVRRESAALSPSSPSGARWSSGGFTRRP
jgi:hypothetical protein